jgi:hypothetical protein
MIGCMRVRSLILINYTLDAVTRRVQEELAKVFIEWQKKKTMA